jgi:Amidohydrolase family
VSWSGDSSTLLYISNGTPRTVSVSGGQPTTVPLDLTWQPDRPTGVHVIHAGALWDGINENLRRDVDITVEGNRIVSIRPHVPNRDYGRGVNFVDASELTVMPGLWESHGHEQMDQPYVGGRKGRHMLSMGTTSVMGMGDPAYESLEQVESEKSNARLLPRFFWAPEAVDGERMNYDFMRATVTDASLERQFDRIGALSADIVKIYVRLQMDWQERTIAAGHALGIPSFSHYTYPAMEFDQDCCSHWATQRLGYHLTMSAASIAYEDTIDLYAESKYGLTITSGRGTMLSTFPNFLEDRRMRQLLTPWQYSQMQGQHSQTNSESVLASTRAFVGAHRRILRAGGIVLCGTDEPLGLNIWGLQATIAGLVHYGDFTEHDALRTVTALPAKVMGLEGEIGTVERGAVADLLFIRGNPLDHIQDLFNIDMVMKNGRLYTIDDLIGPYAHTEPASAASSNGDAPTTVALASGGSMRRASRARAPLGAFMSFEGGTVDYGVDEHC